jgi:hypothetical protein
MHVVLAHVLSDSVYTGLAFCLDTTLLSPDCR